MLIDSLDDLPFVPMRDLQARLHHPHVAVSKFGPMSSHKLNRRSGFA